MTFNLVSWMPANECPALSSSAAEERTANIVGSGNRSNALFRSTDGIDRSIASAMMANPSGTGKPACLKRPQL
ncbi:MAG: hypothetical protein NWE89_11275 [Candidatus Bathyarchaeota archaeon]|nr:hypothetical protein [Candidatus Bathyarchaeota archaeon]